MKSLPAIRLASVTLVAAALVADPTSVVAAQAPLTVQTVVVTSAAPPQLAGIYRLTFSGKGHASKAVHLLLQKNGAEYDGYLLTDGAEAILTDLRFDGDELRASALTSAGKGELTLKLSGNGVTGKLIVGKHVVAITGDRAS